jgi:hypothetical protein
MSKKGTERVSQTSIAASARASALPCHTKSPSPASFRKSDFCGFFVCFRSCLRGRNLRILEINLVQGRNRLVGLELIVEVPSTSVYVSVNMTA